MNVRPIDLQLTAVSNQYFLGSLATTATDGLHILNNIFATFYLTKDNMLPIKPAGDGGSDEELRAIGVLTRIRHREHHRLAVLVIEIFILKFAPVYALATGTIPGSKITTLAHKTGNNSVKLRALVSETLLTGAQCTEVLYCLWDVIKQGKDDATRWLTANGDVEEALHAHYSRTLTDRKSVV